jgi:hypothetical protein
MNKNTKIVLGIGALALIGWFIYKNNKQTQVVEATTSTDPDEELAYMMLASPMFHPANWSWNPTQSLEITKSFVKNMSSEIKDIVRKYALSENIGSATESDRDAIMSWSSSLKEVPEITRTKAETPSQYTKEDLDIVIKVGKLQNISENDMKLIFAEQYLRCKETNLTLCKELPQSN